MRAVLDCLPQGLDNFACNDFIHSAPLTAWLPVLNHLQREFGLPDGVWERIPQGANALFGLGGDVIVELVPPNWRRQGNRR